MKYAYYDTLVLQVTEIVTPGLKDSQFTKVHLSNITGEVSVLTEHLFDTELEASKFAIERAKSRVLHLEYRIKELEGKV
jgi:hypothetical protein